MTDEPYRWLEAIANRREYIREQLRGATPVFAFSRPEGVVLLGVGTGQSKVFEIYDRQALAALGNPVDIEKLRQTIIESAHTEGFNRAPDDVSVRRLLNFSLSPALKGSFEQIFTAPLIVECIFAEVGLTPESDVMARVRFDGTHHIDLGGISVACVGPAEESAVKGWLQSQIKPDTTLKETLQIGLAAWLGLTIGSSFIAPVDGSRPPLSIPGKVVEAALLKREPPSRVRYRQLNLAQLA